MRDDKLDPERYNRIEMSSEGAPSRETVSQERVERASRAYFKWEQVDANEIAAFFGCSLELIQPAEVKTVREVARRLSLELTRFALERRRWFDVGSDASYLKWFYQGVYSWHDFVHCLVEGQLRMHRGEKPSFIPLLVAEGPVLNDEPRSRMELHTHLWRTHGSEKKTPKEWQESLILRILEKNPRADFETIYSLYMDAANERAAENVSQSIVKHNSAQVIMGAVDPRVAASRKLGARMKAAPEPELLARLRRIFDGYRAGNKRILLDEFLAMARETTPDIRS